MNTLDVLKATRELLSDPDRWTQGYYAYAADGEPVEPDDEDACKFCLVGAMLKVGGCDYDPDTDIYEAQRAVAPCLPDEFVNQHQGRPYIPKFNDHPGRTHSEILGVLDCAIAKASA